jgi:hypothetical protein
MPQGLMTTDEDWMRWIETARTAIDKAIGETHEIHSITLV